MLFTLYVRGGFFTHSGVLSKICITSVCVSSCLAGKVVVIPSWDGSLFVSRLVGYWLGLGGMELLWLVRF